MTALIEMLKTELNNLLRLQSDLANDPVKPEKATVVTRRSKRNTFYLKAVRVNGKLTQKYLGDNTSKELHAIARSSYKQRLITIIDDDIKSLQQIISTYRSYDRSAVIACLSPALVNVPFDTEFSTVMKRIRDWANADYKKNPKPFGDRVITAKNGRRVRSKSECIVYNALLDAGIPFRYDSIIKLKRVRADGTVETFFESPDFLILCPDGSYIIIEHAGKLNSMQYAESLAKKLQLYQLNGFFQGHSLFVTSDDVSGGIDSHEIEKIIKTISARFPYL